jgi:hypothetical protein
VGVPPGQASALSGDACLAEYESNGGFSWVRHFGGVNSSTGVNGLAFDANGDAGLVVRLR